MKKLFAFLLVLSRCESHRETLSEESKIKNVVPIKDPRKFDKFYPDDAMVDMMNEKIYKPTLS